MYQYIIRILINDYNVEINGKNRYGNSQIHIAARMGNNEILQLLLKHNKCDINILTTTSSVNSLTIAVAHNNLSTAYLLLGQTIKCKVQDSALIYAAMNENGEELIRLLLNHGANVNGIDQRGNTALMHAVSKSHEKNVVAGGFHPLKSEAKLILVLICYLSSLINFLFSTNKHFS